MSTPATEPAGEAGPVWRHSTYSHGADQTCVDVALTPHRIGVRDSKDPAGPALWFSPREWHVFLLAVRDGQFDVALRDG